MVIPIEINGAKLQFILDTGVNKTILFNLSEKDSIELKNVKRVQLQGLGYGKPIDALVSKGNDFRIKNMRSFQQGVYVVLQGEFDLSAKMGTTIHGIIGYDLLKNVIAKVNYNNKTIDFYNPKKYRYKKCRKCEVFPLQFYRNKPFIDATIQMDTIGKAKTNVKLLIDSGGSDAMWLFDGSKEEIVTPKKHFRDFLGEGLSGTIYGNRSKIPQLKLGQYVIERPTVSFLDSLSSYNARKFRKRNGSIGGNILKRFKVWIDYPNKRLILKKQSSLKKGFYYNMSGMSLIYDGKELVKEEEKTKVVDSYQIEGEAKGTTISFFTVYKFKFKPSYKIDKVIADSPAGIAGLEVGDRLKKINGRPASNYTIDQINGILQSKPNKKVRIEVERFGLGEKLKFEFRLKERI